MLTNRLGVAMDRLRPPRWFAVVLGVLVACGVEVVPVAHATCSSQLRLRSAALTCPIHASLAVSPNPTAPGTSVTLDASQSTGSTGASVTGYAFDFGTGTFGASGPSATATHVFSTRGRYVARVQVTDATGASDIASATVYASAGPQASASAAPNPVSLGHNVTFDGSASSEAAPGQLVNYEWDFENTGTFVSTGTSAIGSHAYTTPGTYTATLRATDDLGQTNTATVNVVARDLPPTARFTTSNNPASVAENVTFDGSASGDADGSIVAYDWDLDGSAMFATHGGTTPALTHAFANPGTYNVRLRTTDNNGSTTISDPIALVISPPSGGGPITTTGGGPPATTSGSDTAPSAATARRDPGSGLAPPAFIAKLNGNPLQKLKSVRRRGLSLNCHASRAATCTLRAWLKASDAQQMHLRTRRHQPLLIGSLTAPASALTTSRIALLLTGLGRRTKLHTRGVLIVIRATIDDHAGHRINASRAFLLRP